MEGSSTPILTIANVSKAFGGTEVLRDVRFDVARGEILGVIGPNGAGKTTLFNIVSGFLKADGGTVEYSGSGITRLRSYAVARRGIGRTFQSVKPFTEMPTLDNVLTPALIRHHRHQDALAAAWEALEEVQLGDRAAVPVESLTTGELRRLELARAMAGGAELLLLDEFLGGLGGQDAEILLDCLRRWRARGGSVLAIEHTMRSMIGLVDRFVVLNYGVVIAQGTSDEIVADRGVIEAYLGDRWAAHAQG